MKAALAVLLVACATGNAFRLFAKPEEPEWSLYGTQPEDGSFQTRQYPEAMWVSTNMVGTNYDGLSKDAFWRLFGYISGDNDREMRIKMTAPVTVKMVSSSCLFCNRTFVMSFYVPRKFQANPPGPSDPSVYLERRPGHVVHVRGFGSYAKTKQMLLNGNRLMEDLVRNNITLSQINQQMMYYAGYNSPMKFWNRKNEVWISPSK